MPRKSIESFFLPAVLPLPLRIGHGYDIHRLRKGGRLVLGGIEVANNLSPIAHSDGDVVLHALVDALMGAMGLGDIGERFPNDPLWKDAPSKVFVTSIFGELKRHGYELINADFTILAEKPRLSPFKSAIAENVSRMLEALSSQINVKAGTNERCDSIGKGQAIACHAVVLLARQKSRSKKTGRARKRRPAD